MIKLMAVCICDACGGVAKREDFVMPKDVKEGEGYIGVHICAHCRHPEWTDEMDQVAMQGAIQ